jgi:hypothetical protein
MRFMPAVTLVLTLTFMAAACNDDDNSSLAFDAGALDAAAGGASGAADGAAGTESGSADGTGTGGTAGADAWPGTCDPVQQNCPSGQQCTGGCNVTGVMAKVFTCAMPAAGAVATNGQDCGAGCARGHDCYTIPNADGGTRSVCRKYCNTDSDCPGTRCVAEGLVCTAGDTNPIGRLCAL